MQVRRFIAGGMVAGLLTLMAVPAGAADVTYTPATTTYGVHNTLKVTGLTPRAAYSLQIYNPVGVPLIVGGFPVVADASGTFTSMDLDLDQTDLPGIYLMDGTTADGKVVTRTSPTLVGTNTYYVQKRLGA